MISGSLAAFASNTLELALQMFYPPTCLGCGVSTMGKTPGYVCEICYSEITFSDTNSCRMCGAPAGKHASLGKGCAECTESRLDFTRAVAVARYEGVIRDIIHSLKFGCNRRLARPVAAQMVQRALEEKVDREKLDMVIPVPLHKTRLRERGYNQSALLARHVANELAVPLESDALHRVRNTKSQAGLKRRERLKNPVGAFKSDQDLTGKKILLVDDVLTTGTTVSECSVALREAGASRVYVIVFAR